MPQDYTEHAAALHAAINSIPADRRGYLLNYVAKNAHRPLKQMLTALDADGKARAQAEQLERHRKAKVLNDYAELTGQGVDVLLAGQASGAGQGDPGKKGR